MTPKKTAQLIDGRALADQVLFDLRKKIELLPRRPGLAAVLVGDDPASASYVRNKKNACHKIGITFHDYRCGTDAAFPDITQEGILEVIDFLNADPTIDGIILQLPLPKRFDTAAIINRIDPKKDVDGFIANKQALLSDDEFVVTPPLIDAIWEALRATGEPMAGKTGVIVSKNPIFSTPLAQALNARGLATTVCTPDDPTLTEQTTAADVLIVVLGRKYFITKSMVKDDAIVIDVGSNLVGENEWVGDVDPSVKTVASWVTPVPGGIGPLTVAMLLKNTYDLAERNQQ
jgi:methylenetetrahydrofolate dehydrogenase (NADP+)/methenyltetrahydrofolate cyclohydrolase